MSIKTIKGKLKSKSTFIFSLTVVLLYLVGFNTYGQQIVTSSEQMSIALSHAKPGAHIQIGPGTFSNWGVTVSKSGTKENPIIISGTENMETVFSGDGTSQTFFLITGDHVYLENVVFENIKFNKSIVRLVGSEGGVLSNCIFRNNQALSQMTYMISVADNGRSNEIRYSHFENILDAVLVQISVRGLRKENPHGEKTPIEKKKGWDPKHPIDFTTDLFPIGTKIHHNIFQDIPKVQWNNGGECIQVGQYQNLAGEAVTKTEVYENKFIRYNGEGEIISNKSSGNSYYNNYFEDCGGSLVIRGGHDCKVFGNEFHGGVGGVRIYGTGHEIFDNLIEGTERGILLGYGTGRGHELTFYSAVENCTIRNNKIIHSKFYAIYVGHSKGVNWQHLGDRISIGKIQDIPPSSNLIYDNLIVGPFDKAIVIDGAPENEIRDNTLTRIQKLKN